MKKQTIFLLLLVFTASLACQFLAPSRTGTVIANCADLVTAVRKLQPADIPSYLLENGKKRGDEFDPNQYFNALTHLSMQEGYVLDYVYQNDGLGASPILYARPADRTPYASLGDIPENTQLPDYHDYLNVQDVEQAYFEYVVMDVMANQFYLFWHANYNDTEIVCNRQDVDDIISRVNGGDFGNKMNLAQQTKARTLKNIEPVVNLTGNVASVQVIVFTNWGGFYRFTYTINRSFPHTITDVKQDNLVPYDCGVAF